MMDHKVWDADAFEHLFPRANGQCATCPEGTPPCPDCPAGQGCQITVPLTCTECPRSYCAPNQVMPTPPSQQNNGPSTGAIAGGVVGGVAVIGLVTYLVWRFCIKNKREPLPEDDWDEEQIQSQLGGEPKSSFAARRDTRASTHTTHSIASTVLTRASNIIQIAYIPGVTNRATPTSPTLLVPPVPPIPIAASQAGSPVGSGDQHFFVPGDLRDSTYSGLSGYSDRTSYARTSYAPRSSIASTIYGKNVVIAAPAQTGMRAKPAMVSVKSANGSGFSTPPVPEVDYEKFGSLRPPSPANSTFSVGSTFLNNASAHTAMPARAMVVRVGSGPKTPNSTRSVAASASASAIDSVPSTPGVPPVPQVRDSTAVTIIEDSPAPDQGPFSDPPKRPTHQSAGSLSAVIEEATRRASQRTDNGTSSERERSPFGDEHATNDQ